MKSTLRAIAIGTGALAVGALGVAALSTRRHSDVTAGRAHASRSVTIRDRGIDLQRAFSDPARLPKFFHGLADVLVIDGTHQQWSFAFGHGLRSPIEMEILSDVPGERFEWRTAPGAAFSGGGSFTIVPAPEGRGTQCRLALHAEGPGAKPIAAFHRLFGASPEQLAMETLRGFKALIEAGEIPTAVRS